ncbi:hypothetical protein LARI1_G005399 [Lachnellula arida]|uniref:Uncharacterized protein n=1 Tax=Lachnellula arida TaxID=1316785 RepID=A0A8T9B9D4_9HELO|nr:hypothetical protein LARI1_G005399 [Lachnellula arida]
MNECTCVDTSRDWAIPSYGAPPAPSILHISRFSYLDLFPAVKDDASILDRPILRVQTNEMVKSHRTSHAVLALETSFEISTDAGLTTLRARGFNTHNVARWAWVVSGDGPDAMMQRFLSDPDNQPLFLFLQIIRLDFFEVRTLEATLTYVWNKLLVRPRNDTTSMADAETDTANPWSNVTHFSTHIKNTGVDDKTFMIIIGRLLYQARRIFSPGMLSIAHMLAPFIFASLDRKSRDPRKLDTRTHQWLCKQYNSVIHLLALPASIEPMKSMVHNWSAQKVLLEQGELFEPPLSLDEGSYRAVAHVLAASKRSETESKAAMLRSRSWPPWREAQDGMDAQSLGEESTSRVILALARKRVSGFRHHSSHDQALRILGGQELDGTPTIHTRKLLKTRSGRSNSDQPSDDTDSSQWAARIEATRDIREAWSAFITYQDQGVRPALSMYFAMFVKIAYEDARVLGKPSSPVPGDGKEVLPVADDNISNYYRSRLQPPTLDELYDQMMELGIRPAGQCLIFLVHHARTIERGIRIIRDSKVIDERSIACLLGHHDIVDRNLAVEKIPMDIFLAFISLVCRFAPRAIWETPLYKDSNAQGEAANKRCTIIEERTAKTYIDPLPHAAELLKMRQSTFRPAWYALFRALARRGVIVFRDLAEHPKNDILAWRVLAAGLGDFHKCGLELDPRGFQIICDGFVKGIEATGHIEDNNEVAGSLPMLKDEFRKLSEHTEGSNHLPRLLRTIHGVHLHAYVRALGVAGEYVEIIAVLKWMVRNHEELNFVAQQSRNGPKLLRRVIVAIKVFCGGTDNGEEAQELVDSIEPWDGWPGDYEAQRYLERWPGWQSYDEGDQE